MVANQYFAGMRKDFDQPFDRQSIMDINTEHLDLIHYLFMYSWQGPDCALCPTFVMRILQIEIVLSE